MFASLRVPARLLLIALFGIASLSLAGCSSKRDPFAGVGSPRYEGSGPLPKGGGRSVVGKPYSVAGVRFVPKLDPNYDRKGFASWYGKQFHRRMTSNGEWFDMEHLTAAHATMPLPSYAKVTNLENGRAIIVRVNDRGPFVGTRIIDMSKRSADVLGFLNQGTAKVRVQYIGPAPNDDQGGHLVAMNEELRRGTPLLRIIAAADRNEGAPRVAVAEVPQAPVEPPAARQVAATDVSSGTEGYFVQAGLFASAANARRAQSALAGVGPVEVQPLVNNYGTYYRVRVGPLASSDSALAALSEIHAAGMPDARLVVAQN